MCLELQALFSHLHTGENGDPCDGNGKKTGNSCGPERRRCLLRQEKPELGNKCSSDFHRDPTRKEELKV